MCSGNGFTENLPPGLARSYYDGPSEQEPPARWFINILLGLLNHLDKAPTLGLAQRPAFHDLHHIAYPALILLVMGVEAGRLLHELPVDRVLHLPFDSDGDGLGHFVALYNTDPC